MDILKQLLLIVILFYAIIVVFLFFMQKRLLFFPTQVKHSLEGKDIVPFSLDHAGATLRGWLLNPKYANRRLIIYYGGNAEDIFHSRDQFVHFKDTGILLVNYRGYGISSGSPGEAELFGDALAIYDNMVKQYNPENIYLVGRSLGSGVATYVSSKRECSGVILITPFDSIEQIAKKHYPLIPVSLFLRHRFRSIDYAGGIKAPVLIIYGGRDGVVPPAHTENLIRHLTSQARIVYIEEAQHNNIEMFDEYQLALLSFIEGRPESNPEESDQMTPGSPIDE